MKDIIQGIKNKTSHLTKNPGAVFGLVYPYVLVTGLLVGIYYVQNLDNVSRRKVPVTLTDTIVVADIAQKNSVVVPPIDIADVKNSGPELLAEGEKLYAANCASCHAENGAGGGPASMGLNPAPRNFTSKDNWKNGTKLSQIYITLQEGLLPSAMASYDYLLPREKFAIAHYLRNSFIPTPENDSDADLQALDATYNLGAGLQIPAQIPVAKASSIIISEYETKIQKLASVIRNLDDYSADPGYEVLKKSGKDRELLISFLLKNENWKQSTSGFINLVINNVNQNGFNGRVFNLDQSEWNSLHKLLLRII